MTGSDFDKSRGGKGEGVAAVGSLADIVQRCIRGDDDAKEEFVDQTIQVVQRTVMLTLKRYAASSGQIEANDACNEVYRKLFDRGCRSLVSLRHAGRLSAWLMTISRNETIAMLRKESGLRRTRMRVEEALPTLPPTWEEDEDLSAEKIAIISRVLASLSSKERLIVSLYYDQGLRYKEIEAITEIPSTTIGSVLSRAKVRIRKKLGIEEEGVPVSERVGSDDML